MTTTIVVVEDEPLLRAGLRELLGAVDDLSVVGDAKDGLEALGVLAATHPDVALVDIRMPVLDGIELTRRITGTRGAPRVLLLTTFGSEEHLIEGLQAGASGFLLKTASPEQVIDAIHAIAAGDSVVAPSMTRSLIERAVVAYRPKRQLPPLSPRELDVLGLLAQGRSDKAIARALKVAIPTVKSHVHRVLTKLGVDSRTQAALVAQQAGMCGVSSEEGTWPQAPSTPKPDRSSA
jgi:DNA-binding NarL/FixJ family response regulator